MREIMTGWASWIGFAVVFAGALIAGLLLHYLLFRLLGNVAKRTKTIIDDSIVRHCKRTAMWIIILLILSFVMPFLDISETVRGLTGHIISPLIIITVAWLLIKVTFVIEDIILDQYRIDEKDNLQARKIYTQIQFLKRAAIIFIAIIALGSILMTFDKVRQLGTSILASAGIISIIIGLAAQRSLGTMLAGLQIAITQPIRIDDVVIVENEWGKIEEITLTYVVVRIWDLRRLILPITYFLEKPFQNWSRVSTDILGTVYLYVDYTVPVQEVKAELDRILDASPLWDRKASGLIVTDTTERTMELRALVSAEDASKAWDLRCEVREKLIEFVQKNYPESLPKVRAELREKDDNSKSI